MTQRRCHYLERDPNADKEFPLTDFARPALCGRTQWGAVSGDPAEVSCKACLKRLAVLLAKRQHQETVAKLGAASYALGRMFKQHGRAWA